MSWSSHPTHSAAWECEPGSVGFHRLSVPAHSWIHLFCWWDSSSLVIVLRENSWKWPWKSKLGCAEPGDSAAKDTWCRLRLPAILPSDLLWGDRWVCAGCVSDAGAGGQMIAQKCTDAVWAWRKQQLMQCPRALKCPQPGPTVWIQAVPRVTLLVRQELLLALFVNYRWGGGKKQRMVYWRLQIIFFFPKVVSNCTIRANHTKSSPWLQWFVTAIKPKHLLVSDESSRDIVWSRGLYSIMALLRKPCKWGRGTWCSCQRDAAEQLWLCCCSRACLVSPQGAMPLLLRPLKKNKGRCDLY